MPFREMPVGCGMTARIVSKYVLPETKEAILQDEDDIKKWIALLVIPSIQNGSWSEHIRLAKLVLAESGLPSEAGMFAEVNGQWIKWGLSDECALAILKFSQRPPQGFQAAMLYARMPEFNEFLELTKLAEIKFGYESPQFYAADLVILAHHVNLARKARLCRVVESLAYEIGRTAGIFELRRRAERTWTTGQKSRAGGMKGAETAHGTAETRHAKRQKIQAVVAEGVALGLKLTPARHRAAKKLGVSYSTVRRAQSSH